MARTLSLSFVFCLAIFFSSCKPSLPVPEAPPADPAAAPVSVVVPTYPLEQPPTASRNPEPSPVAPPMPASPNPLSVSPQLEESLAVESTLPEIGGVIRAESNGVRYSLTVPEGALISEQDIRLIPVQSIEGLPMSGGLLGAVQLEPDGLSFLQPAILEIEIPSGFDPLQATGFAYRSSGEEFHLYPSRVEGNTLLIEIWHFSGYGGGAATPDDLDRQMGHPPTNPEDLLNQKISDIIKRSQQADTDFPLDQIIPILRDYLNNVLLPLLKAAETDDQLIDQAGRQLLSFDRNISLIGIIDQLDKELNAGYKSLEKGVRNAYDKAYQRCVDKPDVFEITNMMKYLREYELLFGGFFSFPGPAPQAADYNFTAKFPEIQSCASFQYRFQSLLTWEFGNNMVLESQVTSDIDLTLTEEFTFEGSGEILYRSFKVHFQGESEPNNQYCKFGETAKDSTASISGGIINWKNTQNSPQIQVQLPFDPGTPLDHFVINCETGSSGGWIELNPPGDIAMWLSGFDHLHEDVRIGVGDSGYAFILGPFEPGGGRLFARHTASKVKYVDTEKVSEDLAIDLFHNPGR
jgi:hypothetical protein